MFAPLTCSEWFLNMHLSQYYAIKQTNSDWEQTWTIFPSQSLLSVHDAVAQRDFEPTLPPIPNDVLEEEEDSVKLVSLVKTKEPLVSKYIFMFQMVK